MNQPRATPWDNIAKRSLSPERARQSLRPCFALSGLRNNWGILHLGRCPRLICRCPFGADDPTTRSLEHLRVGQADHSVKNRFASNLVCKARGGGGWPEVVPDTAHQIVAA